VQDPDRRTRLDLAHGVPPIELAPADLPLTPGYSERLVAALDGTCPATRALLAAGLLPPHAVTGNTIFLLASGHEIAGGVYVREQVTYHRPPRIGETLRVEGEVVAIWSKRGRRYRATRSRSLDTVGASVASSRSTGIERYRTDPGAIDTPPDPAAASDAGPAPDAGAAAANPCLDALRALRPGQRIDGEPRAVRLDMMRALAGRDDRNPIHTDPEVAQREVLGAPIAGGPHVLAFLQEVLMEALGPESLLYGAHFDVRWISPVRAGCSIAPWATVAVVEPERVLLDLAVDCEGERAMVGSAALPLPTHGARSAS